ncbi:MAG: hypothetical protein HY985_06205 [Magnetospirillum sp.]|nr:hypothetical protein [Magnetospirillum sp.]
MNARRLTRLATIAVAMAFGLATLPASAAEIESAIARGGRLYDTWYKEVKKDRPENTHPSYPAAGKAPKQSWRCVACHGWDYRGKDGAAGKGGDGAGIKGITGANGKDPKAIAEIIRNPAHAYTPEMLTDKDVGDLALFVSKQIDLTKFADAATGKPKGNAGKGEVYYNTLCAVCHGTDGKKVSTGKPLGEASDNAWLMLHKAFNGQPGESMPMLRAFDNSIGADIVAYTQTLPK